MVVLLILILLIAGGWPNHFQSLLDSAIQTQMFLYAPGSSRNIRSHIRTYFIFCSYFGRTAVPADSDTLVTFAELMSVTAGYAHIKHIFGSIKLLHNIYNIEFIEHDFHLDVVLQFLKQKTG